VWKINEEGLGLPRFQAVTKFQAHNKYLTRCLLSPDVKWGIVFSSLRISSEIRQIPRHLLGGHHSEDLVNLFQL
jgi:hypothetical protein